MQPSEHERKSQAVKTQHDPSSLDDAEVYRATKGYRAEKQAKRKQTPAFYIVLVIAVLAIVVAGFLVFRTFFADQSSTRDPNAALGQLANKSQDEVQAELNRAVEEGMFNISIAPVVDMADGQSEAELRIENVPGNRYLMQVEIARDDTGEVVYKTGLIEPNHHIQRTKLDADLDAGTYPCTASFYAHDVDTEELIGQAAAKMTITVQS